jgi:hypothetical protein
VAFRFRSGRILFAQAIGIPTCLVKVDQPEQHRLGAGTETMTEPAARESTCSRFRGGYRRNSRVPGAERSGTMCSRSSSIRPAARDWLMVLAPPWIETSPSPAASRAWASYKVSLDGPCFREHNGRHLHAPVSDRPRRGHGPAGRLRRQCAEG